MGVVVTRRILFLECLDTLLSFSDTGNALGLLDLELLLFLQFLDLVLSKLSLSVDLVFYFNSWIRNILQW